MMRLDKLLASSASISRTQAQDAIRRGRVTADGEVIRKPETKVDEKALLQLDGRAVEYEKYVYIMMDKPAGYLSATEDTRDPSVTELLPEELRKRSLGIVGRLDKDTTGLLLLTDDGELNHRLTSPRYHMDKVYDAYLELPAVEGDVEYFASGIEFSDFTAMPAKLEISGDPRRCFVTLREGKFHQVKRMFEKCGNKVTSLRRLSIGELVLDPALGAGGYRKLTEKERDLLLFACGLKK